MHQSSALLSSLPYFLPLSLFSCCLTPCLILFHFSFPFLIPCINLSVISFLYQSSALLSSLLHPLPLFRSSPFLSPSLVLSYLSLNFLSPCINLSILSCLYQFSALLYSFPLFLPLSLSSPFLTPFLLLLPVPASTNQSSLAYLHLLPYSSLLFIFSLCLSPLPFSHPALSSLTSKFFLHFLTPHVNLSILSSLYQSSALFLYSS